MKGVLYALEIFECLKRTHSDSSTCFFGFLIVFSFLGWGGCSRKNVVKEGSGQKENYTLIVENNLLAKLDSIKGLTIDRVLVLSKNEACFFQDHWLFPPEIELKYADNRMTWEIRSSYIKYEDAATCKRKNGCTVKEMCTLILDALDGKVIDKHWTVQRFSNLE